MPKCDFSYSYDSLNDVFNAVNRKGKMQKKYLSEGYLRAAQSYRNMRKELNGIIRKKKADRSEIENNRIEELTQSMKDNAQLQKKLLQEHLTDISQKILSGKFRFNLTADDTMDKKKPLYVIGDTAEEFLAMQVLCRNVKKLFRISMSGRDEILSQLKILLQEDKHRKYIIRMDVRECFEHIPHNLLFDYLEGNSLLDVKSKSLLKGLIKKEFETKNLRRSNPAPNTGIPRGCAISSLLSEFYLSKIDEDIKRTLPEIVFLGRYVDDMVLVIHPDICEAGHKDIDWYVNELNELFKKKGLELHTANDGSGKYYAFDSDDNRAMTIEFLGYSITSKPTTKTPEERGFFSLSTGKIDKIQKRIDKSFEKFNALLDTSTYDVAAHYLFDALHVLTANINLYNAKRDVKVGVFYSNQLLDNKEQLKELDEHLQIKSNQIDLSTKACIDVAIRADLEKKLKQHLGTVSFVKGFNYPHKRYKISRHRLKTIKQSWL